MKKVMFAAVAMTACVGLSEITSQNVVGYQDKTISGYVVATPTFETIGAKEYPIDSLVVKNATDGQTQVQVFDANGQVAGDYYWYNEYTDPQTGTTYPAGWFDNAGLVAAEYSFKPAEGGLFYTTEENVTAQASGQVAGDITCNLGGYMVLGNPSPVDIAIDKAVVTGATDGQTQIQVFDAAGQVSGDYYWYNEYTDPQTGTTYPAGWFDNAGLIPAGYTLKTGEAALFYTTEEGVTIKFPGAL